MDGSLQTRDLHTQQGLVLVQSDQLSALLRLQLHLQQLLLLVQELVQVAELGFNALLQVSGVLLSRWEMMDIVTGRNHLQCFHKDANIKSMLCFALLYCNNQNKRHCHIFADISIPFW